MPRAKMHRGHSARVVRNLPHRTERRLRQSPHYSPRDPTASGAAAMGPTERKKKFATTLDIEEWLEREFQQWRNETGGVSPRVMAEIPTRAPPGYRAFG